LNTTWLDIKRLGEGGQGTVTLVRPEGRKDPLDHIIESIRLLQGTSNRQIKAAARDRLGENLIAFVNGEYVLGAKKQLLTPTEESVARLMREAEVYESISDPHLLKVLDQDINGKWLVTEYQPNGTLEAQLEAYRGDAIGTLRAIRPLVNVLAKMHAAKFVHRDFKPGNIFIGRKGQLVLGDAGLAFYIDDSARPTKTYESVGTQHYMPAWAYGRRLKEINPTFDAFSVGKVIWALIAGEPACPFWYVFRPDNKLTSRFPGRIDMFWINELLTKCVVEDESSMKIQDGAEFMKQIDQTLRAITLNAIPPDIVHQIGNCRVCFIGTYKEDNAGYRGTIARPGTCYRCDSCGHLEFYGGRQT